VAESDKINSIEIDSESLSVANADAEHERRVAIFDLLQDNFFRLEQSAPVGPYDVVLSVKDQKLIFQIEDSKNEAFEVSLSLMPFRRIIKDYFQICQTYHEAIRNGSPLRIEAIDMGRRGLHNEGSELLTERLEGKVKTDFDTSRRLFTLICALHQRSGQV
jgi:uncharacterized protein (UPF0262 family)